MPIACKYCIMTKGLKGSEISSLPKTDEELFEHIESVHNIPVKRKNETVEECKKRFYAKYPEALDPATCKCPACAARRSGSMASLAECKRLHLNLTNKPG